jgi:hypothetical protein
MIVSSRHGVQYNILIVFKNALFKNCCAECFIKRKSYLACQGKMFRRSKKNYGFYEACQVAEGYKVADEED